jgi:hypothetical protein
MAQSQLESDIKILQGKIYAANFDILSILPILPKEEIVKNIMLSKNSSMKPKDAEIIIYGYEKSAIPGGVGTPNPNFSGIYPLKKDHQIYKEADKILNSVREAGMKLVKESEAIAVDLITTSVKIANSVAAMVQLIAPVTFNVPAAIALLLLIIDAIAALIKRITDVITLLEPLTQLALIVDITSMISGVAAGLSSLVNPLTNAANTVSTNIETATSTASGISSSSISNINKPSIPSFGTPEFNSYFDIAVIGIDIPIKLLIGLFEPISVFQLIIEWLLGELSKAVNNAHKSNPTQSSSTIFPTKDDLNSKSVDKYLNLLKGLTSSFSIPSLPKQSGTQSGTSSYAYDVLLPDGTVLSNLDDNSFESIKERYNVIFNTDASV